MSDFYERIQMNAGVICKNFNPATGAVADSDILGATTGGITFNMNPTFVDFGEDVDNMPANTYQMKRITAYDPVISGTFLEVNAERLKMLIGGADADSLDATHIIPRGQLEDEDFADVWLIGDYSDKNANGSGKTAGYVAIHLKNALNTAGFQWTTTKDGKGQFAFEFHGHYDLSDLEDIPFEVYIKAGTGSGSGIPSIRLSEHYITVADEATYTLTASARNASAGASIAWSSANTSIATVADGVVTGKDTGSTIITVTLTDGGVAYTDTCTVIVTA